MASEQTIFDKIEVIGNNQVLSVGHVVLAPGQIKHIIVNEDTRSDDRVAGSVVIETMPTLPTGWQIGPAEAFQVQTDFTDQALVQHLTQFSSANGIAFTTTQLDNAWFHKTFWTASAEESHP